MSVRRHAREEGIGFQMQCLDGRAKTTAEHADTRRAISVFRQNVQFDRSDTGLQ